MSQAGYTPIQLYYSTTAAAVPTAGNLASGELAINITDGKLYYKNNSGTVTLLAGSGGGGPAAGSNTQIQFNNSGVFGASSSLTWDGTYLTAGSIKDSALTSGRVTFAGASGLLTDSANLTFNGTTLTANTIGAFTLGGTIAGGGNQINNVIIGTTTPLAGAFTTLSATGLITGRSTNGQVFTSTNSVDSTFSIDISSGKVTISQLASAGTLDTVIGSTTRTSVSSTGFAVTGTLSSTLDATIYGLTVGRGAGAVSTNTAVGSGALINNSSGVQNTVFGYQAGYVITTGGYNTAIGASIMDQTAGVTGQENTAVGRVNMRFLVGGSYNTAVGNGSLSALISGSNNTAVGYQALGSNNSASGNTAVGYQSLLSNNTGTFNTAVGFEALANNTDNSANTAVGYRALKTQGASTYQNTAMGAEALTANISGVNNSGFGRSVLLKNTTGSNNTAMGFQAFAENTTGGSNVGFGYGAGMNMVSADNMAIGDFAMRGSTTPANNTGYQNTAVGRYTMFLLTSGIVNTALGDQALYSNSSGQGNVALGATALLGNTTASFNTAVGYQALYTNASGPELTAVGYQAGYLSTAGYSTFVGYKAGVNQSGGDSNTYVGRGITGNAASGVTTGSYNTAMGNYALSYLTSGANNVAIGAGSLSANTSASNNTAVGYQAGYNYNGTNGYNTLFGYQAGYSMTGGLGNYANVLIGHQAGYSLNGTTSESLYNTFVGPFAGYAMTTGASNTILGRFDGNQGGLDIRTASNYIVLSDGAGNPRLYSDANGNITIPTSNTARPIQFSDSQIIMNGQAGGWQIGLFFRGSAGTTIGGFGTLGNSDSLDYNFVGPSYTNTFARFGSTGMGLGNTSPANSGVGITFPATQSASSDANTLDDYEEGTWTPVLTEAGTDRGPTYQSRGGRYVKIGNTVYCQFGIALSNKGAGSGGGQIRIEGLPFTGASYGSYQEPTVKFFGGGFTTAATVNSLLQVTGGAAYLRGWLADNAGAGVGATATPYTEVTDNSFFAGEIFYNV